MTTKPNDTPGSSGSDDDGPLPEDGVRRDVRRSRREDLGVEVTRDLTSQGRLARGSHTNMSRLSFRMGAVPREEKDPELEALSAPPMAAPKPMAASTDAPPPESKAMPATPPDAVAPPGGAIARLFSGLFGRRK